jgi:ubiquinone/menaquinone biosynthesis C-methylase UbiE
MMAIINNVSSPALPQNKGSFELTYWRNCKAKEGTLSNSHYQYFYTEHFGFPLDFYTGKRILDIGCGPRGSLEWATMAQCRVGLDPLAGYYSELGINNHQMLYVAAPSEAIPFPSDYFDVVCSFNSLDHVDNLDKAIAEMIRVVRPSGVFLLLTDLNHNPTPTEPITFSWDIVERFKGGLTLLMERHFEKSAPGMYESIRRAVPYDKSNPAPRYGVLSALFRK